MSTTQIVASSVVGVGGGRRRWRHVRWRVVRTMLLAWLVTVPAAGCSALSPWCPGGGSRELEALVPPREPDLLGMLREQAAITVEGMDALVGLVGRRRRRGRSCARL